MSRILIVDDDPQIGETLAAMAARLEHQCLTARTLREALSCLRQGDIDLVFLDVRLPDGNGLDALGAISALSNPPYVIVLTGQGDPEGAELAIRSGVWDYLVKPSPIRQIRDTLNRALASREEKRDPGRFLDLTDVVGQSPAMRRQCYERIAQASGSDSTVLITGETGTGKELLARTIHRNSTRSAQSFVPVDCAALAESLLESTLFGHVKGAFTGATRDGTGLVKLADQGTLFLDEIGELPLSAQKTFLRVLQERRFRPVGSSQELESDFRLVCATNQDLEGMVRAGRFRQDLFYRINTIRVELPPLREREGDIEPLARHHIERFCRQHRMPCKTMAPEFVRTLEQYEWPGNVRELFNTVEQALVLSGAGQTVYAQHLPRSVRVRAARSLLARPEAPMLDANGMEEAFPTLKDFKSRMEAEYLAGLIKKYGRDVQRMAQVSGLSRSHLYAVLKKHGLDG
ncbi:MAG: sigma-54 dependent transcriptional regulator [Pseudomonadota bacterium]|nr:sigma-54 dependent transcriptional regulator [Pseudomonadota bacterium]